MPVDNDLLDDATVALNTGFENALSEPPPPQSFLGILAVGPIEARTMRVKNIVLGLTARWREWIGERIYNDVARFAFEYKHKPYELSYKMNAHELTDDMLGGFGDIGADIARKFQWWARDQIIDAIKAGGSTNIPFDGQWLFDTDHPVDPATPGAGVFSNVATGRALTADNLRTTLSAIRGIKGPGGRTLNLVPRFLLVPPALEWTAKDILIPDRLANGAQNTMRGALELEVVNEFGGADGTWYVVSEIPGDRAKPFVISILDRPEITVLNKRTDLPYFEHKEIRWGGDARAAAVPALPHLIFKASA